MRIIHRRILWLIGRWINVSFSKESRVTLYQILIKMMDKKEDLVVSYNMFTLVPIAVCSTCYTTYAIERSSVDESLYLHMIS